MELTTVIFFLLLAAAFITVRFLLSPSPHSPTPRGAGQSGRSRAGRSAAAVGNTDLTRSRRRVVTDSMVEVVQAIAPGVPVAAIRYDLERTGNVEETIDNYLNAGTLPMPPGVRGGSAESSGVSTGSASPAVASNSAPRADLVDVAASIRSDTTAGLGLEDLAELPKMKWSSDRAEREKQLKQQQMAMKLKARKRLEERLAAKTETK